MTRSHFGDLQFLHSMADADGVPASETRSKILGWAEFAWRVAQGEYGADKQLKSIAIQTIQIHFGCTEWTVSDLYILGYNDKLRPRIQDIAFGSLLHTVQDSFAGGHVERVRPALNAKCENYPTSPAFGQIVEFHTYGAQDSHKHDAADSRDVLILEARDGLPEAIVATAHLALLYNRGETWDTVSPYLECIYSMSDEAHQSSPGTGYSR